MKLTKRKLKQLVKEEMKNILRENKLDTPACQATIKDIKDATKCIVSVIRNWPEITKHEKEGNFKLDVGPSKNIPGGMYMTFLCTEDFREAGKLKILNDLEQWLNKHAWQLKDDKTGFTFRVGYTYSGWQKPPAEWKLDPKWYVPWNGYVAPVTEKDK